MQNSRLQRKIHVFSGMMTRIMKVDCLLLAAPYTDNIYGGKARHALKGSK
jgi:hypothetical protein